MMPKIIDNDDTVDLMKRLKYLQKESHPSKNSDPGLVGALNLIDRAIEDTIQFIKDRRLQITLLQTPLFKLMRMLESETKNSQGQAHVFWLVCYSRVQGILDMYVAYSSFLRDSRS